MGTARIWTLVGKEFLALLRDKKSRLVLVGPPLLQLVVFGYAATYDLHHVPYAVYTQDRSAPGRELLAAFHDSPAFRQVAQLGSEAEVSKMINARKVLMVLRLGPGFSRNLLLGNGGDLQVIIDGRDSNTALIALNYARTIVQDFNLRWTAEHGGPAPPAHLEMRAWFNPNLESRWFIVPGMVGLLTLVVTMMVTALSVAREREQGTFEQLLVTPLRPAEILLGKALPGFVIGMVEATVIMTAAVYWFDVPLVGSVAALYIGVALFLLSAIGVGLMVSSLALTQQQGLLGAFLFLVPSVILSGFATPIGNMPKLVQDLTLLNPLRYFMVIVRGVFLEAKPFTLLLHQLWPMAVIGVTALVIASWMFRRRMA
ncbi:MAG: ABC transporter permease [Arenicellales bacterium]